MSDPDSKLNTAINNMKAVIIFSATAAVMSLLLLLLLLLLQMASPLIVVVGGGGVGVGTPRQLLPQSLQDLLLQLLSLGWHPVLGLTLPD